MVPLDKRPWPMLNYFPMTDKIFLHGLKVFCIIGTLPQERKKKQPIVLDLEFPAPVPRPAKTDDLRQALDYQKIAASAISFASKNKFFLLETLAERLAKMLLREFKLKSLSLRVMKPKALRNIGGNAGVCITRKAGH